MAELLYNSSDADDDFESRFCDPNLISPHPYNISKSTSSSLKLKFDRWSKYLKDTTEVDEIQFDDLFNIPEQAAIDKDCQYFVDQLELSEADRQDRYLTLRTIITIYSISENKPYNSKNGWIPLLNRLIKEENSKLKNLISFKRTRDRYIPAEATHGFFLRLLLRYHYPEFCNWMNNKKLALANCTKQWFNTLFIGICSESVSDLLLDYFISNDSYRIFFVVLSIIKSRFDKMENLSGKKKLEKSIELLPTYINTNDVKDILELAKSYDMNTPSFFKTAFHFFMFGEKREAMPQSLPKYLPSSVPSVLENLRFGNTPNILFNYFLIDCRPSEQYDAGRLLFERMHHINCYIFTSSSPRNINHAIQSLQDDIKNANDNLKNKEIHVCLFGSQLATKDKCVLAVAKKLLEKNQKYVSILYGGFKLIHNSLKLQGELGRFLINHNERKCIVCAELNLAYRMKKRFLRSTGHLRKELSSCVFPINVYWEDDNVDSEYNSDESDDDDTESYASKSQSGSAGSKMHSISSGQSSEIQPKLVSLNDYLTLPNIKIFECKEIESSGRIFPSKLIINETRLIHLRNTNDLKDKAYLIVNCHILCIQELVQRGRLIKIIFDRRNKDMIILFDDRTYLIKKINKFKELMNQRIIEQSAMYGREHENR